MENGVNVLSSAEAIQLLSLKHPKTPFNANEDEKAYMLGLVEGDLHARKKSEYVLRLTTGTTHKSFVELVKSVVELQLKD